MMPAILKQFIKINHFGRKTIFILQDEDIIKVMQFQIDHVSSKATLIKRNKIKRIIVATIWLLARGMKKYKFLLKR